MSDPRVVIRQVADVKGLVNVHARTNGVNGDTDPVAESMKQSVNSGSVTDKIIWTREPRSKLENENEEGTRWTMYGLYISGATQTPATISDSSSNTDVPMQSI